MFPDWAGDPAVVGIMLAAVIVASFEAILLWAAYTEIGTLRRYNAELRKQRDNAFMVTSARERELTAMERAWRTSQYAGSEPASEFSSTSEEPSSTSEEPESSPVVQPASWWQHRRRTIQRGARNEPNSSEET